MTSHRFECLGAGLAGLAYLAVCGSLGPWWITALKIALAGALTVCGAAECFRVQWRSRTTLR